VWSRCKAASYRFLLLVGSVLSLCATQLLCRIPEPPYMVDVRELGEKAPIVFRGQVVDISSTGENPPEWTQVKAIATFQVDRVYRGHVGAETPLPFAYDWFMAVNGHECINFQPNTYWVVFAQEKKGRLELSDDCNGALAISPLLGPSVENEGWLDQMEADFIAGLRDSDPASRLISIQRLGGLSLPSSRDALHRVIETGDKKESGWAIYAALRTGDFTVLPRVKQLLQVGDHAAPESAIALQLRNVAEGSAVVDLIAILQSAPGELTRSSVLIALGEKLKDPRAVPILAAHLSDSDHYARYDALDGLRNITHENACTLQQNWREQDVEPQILKCKTWWELEGQFQSWTQR
jgi:hypothetical protein